MRRPSFQRSFKNLAALVSFDDSSSSFFKSPGSTENPQKQQSKRTSWLRSSEKHHSDGMIVDFSSCSPTREEENGINDEEYDACWQIPSQEPTNFEDSIVLVEDESSQQEDHVEGLVHGWQMMARLFEIWDKDNSGTLDQEEILSVITKFCRSNNLPHSPSDTLRIFEEVDDNNDKELDQREFAVFLNKYAGHHNIRLDEMAYLLMIDQLQTLAEEKTQTPNKTKQDIQNIWGFVRTIISTQIHDSTPSSESQKDQSIPNAFNILSETMIEPRVKPQMVDVGTQVDPSDFDDEESCSWRPCGEIITRTSKQPLVSTS